jgi:hypothetical protein
VSDIGEVKGRLLQEDATHVFEVTRATGNDFGDDEVFDACVPDAGISDFDRTRAPGPGACKRRKR